jgi:hypothetical protein
MYKINITNNIENKNYKYNLNEDCSICKTDCTISLDELEYSEEKEEEYKNIAYNTILKNSTECNINIESKTNIYTPSQIVYQLKNV